jgi:enterochelin esterase family protein
VVATFFGTPRAALGQEPQPLVSGWSAERTLGPGENHAYTITLQEGTAVIGQADQHGVDLVIDVFGPDGKLVRTVDSPNGTEGPEPIDVTAFSTGLYKLVIHTLEEKVNPGKYVIKVDRVLTAEENGQRMAQKNYPPALSDLWRAYRTNPKAVENFVAGRKGKGPIIEDLPDDSKNVRVTYLYYGTENTEKVRTSGGPHADVGGIMMQRFLRTPLFFATEIVPKESRYRYNFAVIETRFVGPGGAIQISEDVFARDVLNPDVFGARSVLTMPDAPPQPYIVKNDSVPHGKVTPVSIKSSGLNEDRAVTIYTPPGYDDTKANDLLILFDGEDYDGSSSNSTSVPTILDNLIAARKINPTVAAFVKNTSGKRTRDLTDSPPFADFVAKELLPWVRNNYRIQQGANHVVAAGASLGGLFASYCAFTHSEAIGNALSLSGSYWLTKDWQHRPPWPLDQGTGDLVSDFRKSQRLPIVFYVAIGRFEGSAAMLGTNRELRDVLLLKGYAVTYQEFNGGHDDIWWRGAIADGLISLLGRKQD